MDRHKQLAIRDLREGVLAWHIWGSLGWHDVKVRYRRSLLGPLWLTLSAAIFIGTIGVLYARFFGQTTSGFVPHVAIGFIVWTLIVSVVNDSCVVFVLAENILKQVNLPLTTHVLRMMWRNVIIFLHNFAIVPIVLLLAGKPLTLYALILPISLVVLLWNCYWLALVLATLCTRFRDIPPIVGNVAQLFFFISPIMWTPEFLGNRIWVAHYNPIYHLIELFRAPLLEMRIPAGSFIVCIAMGVVGSAFCYAVLARLRHRITYWL
jgi:ABC-type polysaccharide/polyol phosphate export permease